LVALLFKVGSAPFHTWLCDVYDGSVLSVTLLFASLPKLIVFSILIKLFFFSFFGLIANWRPFFLVASISSIAVGSISAIYQKRIKRLFAYSTIAHTGFILLGILASSVESSTSLIFYIVVYALLTVLLFSLLIFSTIASSNTPKYIVNWTAFGTRNPLLAVCFSLILFSIAGIPPLAGFFSKLFVILSIISQEYYVTSFIIVMISSVACFYYIRLIKVFFFTKTSKNSLWISSKSKNNTELIIGSLMIFNTCLFLRPDILSNLSTVVGFILF
jgi:NADH-quinone oxidoreductase subunit N